MVQFYHNRAPLSRVNKRQPCSICGKPDWCSISTDGEIAICMRVSNGSTSDAHNGGYLHILRRDVAISQSKPQPASAPPIPAHSHPQPQATNIADIERRHAVYSALLDALVLSPYHVNNLLARGLSEDAITRNLYASVLSYQAIHAVVNQLAARFNLSGVPGFYRENGQWQFVGSRWAGFFVPVRDVRERIQAMQFRCDDGKARYVWVSSKDKPDGASSGAPIHISAPYWIGLKPTARVWLTEGALKADVIAGQTENAVIAVAGVHAFNQHFARDLKSTLPTVSTIAIAFDADSDSNPQVAEALQRAALLLHAGGFRVQIARWNQAHGKGLDDVIVNLSRRRAQEAQA